MTASRFSVGDLPNFLESEQFNRLRARMGAELIAPISQLSIPLLTIDEILRTTGHDVDITEVEFLDDGTFSYKNRKVILHIRDIKSLGDDLRLPKYHLANCKTLVQMWGANRSGRYVVSTRTDGVFRVKIHDQLTGDWSDRDEALDVCKNCLAALNWKNYNANSSNRSAIFAAFTLADFFDAYPNAPVSFTAQHTDVTAPTNDYTGNFSEVSKRYRDSVNWRCEECGYDLSSQSLRRYLHVHHRDGMKNNNSSSNLKAVCVECHSKEDMHSHMIGSRDLNEYRRLRRLNHLGR